MEYVLYIVLSNIDFIQNLWGVAYKNPNQQILIKHDKTKKQAGWVTNKQFKLIRSYGFGFCLLSVVIFFTTLWEHAGCPLSWIESREVPASRRFQMLYYGEQLGHGIVCCWVAVWPSDLEGLYIYGRFIVLLYMQEWNRIGVCQCSSWGLHEGQACERESLILNLLYSLLCNCLWSCF